MQPHQHAQETLKTLVISSETPTWTAFHIGKFSNLYLTKVNKDIADLKPVTFNTSTFEAGLKYIIITYII